MVNQLRDIGEAMQAFVGDDPALHGGLLALGAVTAAVGLGSKAYRWARGKPAVAPDPEKRVRVNIDAPDGTAVDLRVNGR